MAELSDQEMLRYNRQIILRGFDFDGCAFDSLGGNVVNGFVTCLVRLRFWVGRFVQLYTNKLATAAVFGVKLHHRMSGCATACEKIEN